MADLFVEIFPLEAASPLIAYRLFVEQGSAVAMAARLAAEVRHYFDGHWSWSGDLLLTDTLHNPDDLMLALETFVNNNPEQFKGLYDIKVDNEAGTDPLIIAGFSIRTEIHALHETLNQSLKAERIKNAHIEREYRARAWVVDNQPAISLSIASRMIYVPTIEQFIGTETAVDEKLIGLWVQTDKTRGEIINVGKDLLLTIETQRGDEIKLAAQEARLVVRLPHLNRFDINPKQATQALMMRPSARAALVKSISDILKANNLIRNAYNSRINSESFFSADFEMNLRFNERVRPYKAQTLDTDFLQCGIYKLKKPTLKVCVVNTLDIKLSDFMEALQRHVKRHFTFSLTVVKERQVRVVNQKNIESAVRAVQKENPDIVLAFFPDSADDGDDEDTDTDAYIKSLTLGRGIPTHIIYQSTFDNPDAMTSIIMGILGKTGNSPFVLTEPLEHADYVVGLDVVQISYKTKEEQKLTAIARVYKADGEFLHYAVRETILEDNKPPYVLMRELFPQRTFANKRTIIHHNGTLPADFIAALSVWSNAIKATFFPVEIDRFGAPRIYGTERGVIKPPWGSAFKLSDSEALLISALPKDDITPQPLHIRTLSAGGPPLAIGDALRGILVWTLLSYNTEHLPKFPVTVINADHVAYWLRKGGSFGSPDGDLPFWL